MTRKDYILIAEALKVSRLRAEREDIALGNDYAAKAIADALGRDNPRFDRERFLKAAGVQS